MCGSTSAWGLCTFPGPCLHNGRRQVTTMAERRSCSLSANSAALFPASTWSSKPISSVMGFAFGKDFNHGGLVNAWKIFPFSNLSFSKWTAKPRSCPEHQAKVYYRLWGSALGKLFWVSLGRLVVCLCAQKWNGILKNCIKKWSNITKGSRGS